MTSAKNLVISPASPVPYLSEFDTMVVVVTPFGGTYTYLKLWCSGNDDLAAATADVRVVVVRGDCTICLM